MASTNQLAYISARVDSASDRLNRILDKQARHEAERLRAEDAERERVAAEKARADSERKREIQSSYNDTFLAFGSQCPAPPDDESPGRYRRGLYDALRRKLAPSHKLATVRSDEVSSSPEVFATFERDLLEAAKAEAVRPSEANLPRDGSMIMRHVVDADTGAKQTCFFVRRSFIADMNTPGRKVACLRNPQTGEILLGRAPAIAPTLSR